ncbi:MAG: glutaredoxin family protein [Rhodocyclaceae bacterium]|nr:glutaredoxin family protein [Rhodocyclaceae bacterium]MBX3677662.1 glutaredoxin family protein [Rhodocyclaceae bacterium]MCO5097384.1 glutaredoxin family protein [Rhodocyclaceae bacterium]MCP5296580.1 glutaredoxin family protein [Zoogloeaceae bacterium]PKO72326.1 MAG: thioredoxin family protein [Betaproteobacteria bacterium HGW-Betaproteobacteria-14]
MATASRLRARLTVYSRAWCHLCDDLLNALRPICEELGADIEVIDIDAHPEFEEAHGERVPVVMGGESELCHYFLDAAAVRAYLLNFR